MITIVLIVLVYIVCPVSATWYSECMRGGRSMPMDVVLFVYIGAGLIMSGIIGAVYAVKSKKPIIVLAIMLVSTLALGFSIYKWIDWITLLGPMVMFCFCYGVVYVSYVIHNKRYKQ